ncbi:MAG: ABC transporter permease [Balneola sp.]|nr:ABC transporter permease [Balneola sp.]MBE78486.1 ABC transporter permease [Balneola sp.]|tara:strand:- start:19329 stop:20552 length:1224 start_codon:yes stop_codon:yes gene_type:complete
MILNIIKLGWKNIWRNPTRSGVVIVAVLLGTWAGIFSAGFMNGMMQDSLNNQIQLSIGHIQITHPKFDDLYNPKYAIENPDELIQSLKQKPYIEQVSAKSMVTGLAQSTRNSYGVSVYGIDTQLDTALVVEQYLVEGDFLEGINRNPVVIGRKLAERLDIKLRSRMVLSFQDVEGEITGGAFRVTGVFDSFSNQYDETNVFVLQEDLNRLIGNPEAIQNIRIYTDDLSKADVYASELRQEFSDVEIKTWREVSPDLRYIFDMMDISLYMVMIIIIIGLIFSIINTMLMAVLERTRELGMLRAIGMNKARTFSLIMLETFFLTMAATPAGLLISWITIQYFATTGIDLSAFAEGMSEYGLSTIVYPELTLEYYLNITLMVAVAALVSAIYPAYRTLKLNPVQAIRKFN